MLYRLVSLLAAVSICFAFPAAPAGQDDTPPGMKSIDVWYGGFGGQSFNDLRSIQPHNKISSVTLRGANRLDRISYTVDKNTFAHGGSGGQDHNLALKGDDYIKTFTVCWGRAKGSIWGGTLRIFYLKLTTRDGHLVEAGKMTEACDTRDPPERGYRLVGIIGSAGNEVDGLRFYYSPI